MSKVYLVVQHLYDEVKFFEPIQLSPEEADAMVERLRKSEPSSPDQPIEWRELEIDFTAAKRAVEHHTKPIKERIDALHSAVAELEKGGGIKRIQAATLRAFAEWIGTVEAIPSAGPVATPLDALRYVAGEARRLADRNST